MQTTGGIDDENVEHALLGGFQRCTRDTQRVVTRVAGVERGAHLLGQTLQLGDRRRTTHVGADQQNPLLARLDEPAREFRCGGRLTGALQTGEQHYVGWLRPKLETGPSAPHEFDELVVDDGNENLARGQAGRDLLPLGFFLDAIEEGLDDREGDVGLQQRHPDLAQGLGDVLLADTTLTTQVLDGLGEFLTQVFEHRMIIAVSDPALPVLIGLLALCLALSAFFSGTETALMSFNRYQLRTMANQGHRGAILAERLLQRPDRLIGLILLGNNLVNNLAATLVAIIVLRTYGEEWVAVGAGVLTLVMLIFCEVGPKTYAAIHPRRLATTSSFIYIALQWLLRPAVYAINWITNGALRLVGLNVDRQTQQNTLSREELRTVVAEAGLMIPRSHQQMLMGILDLERITVNDIMIPRQEISGIDLDDDWERILDQLRQTPHTRLPVYRGDMGNMVGLLHMKRVAQELARGSLDRERLGEVAVQREPYYVPEGTPLTTQLQNFQRDRRRLGFVVDEYGEVMGLVTLEDILEEIVGEFTQNAATLSHRDIHQDRSGAYIINGGTTIRTLNRTLGWKLPTDGPKTLNGLLIEQLETIPTSGTSLRLDNLEMEVLQVADNTVRTVKVRVTSESAAEGDRESLG